MSPVAQEGAPNLRPLSAWKERYCFCLDGSESLALLMSYDRFDCLLAKPNKPVETCYHGLVRIDLTVSKGLG
jgi:hypothetical protein